MTTAGDTWRFTLLDQVSAEESGRRVTPHGKQQRIVLTMLLLNANQTVPAAVLADRLWRGSPPKKADDALRRVLSDVRKLLHTPNGGAPRLGHSSDEGWSIRVDPGELDTDRFERATESADVALGVGDPSGAVASWRAALALTSGRPMVDVVDELEDARTSAVYWEKRRLTAVERCLATELDLGHHHAIVDEVQQLVDENPLREALVHSLMRAQYHCGRQAEALASLARLRTHLREELGLDPDPRLIELERQILQHTVDTSLVPSDGAGSTARADRPGMALVPGEGTRPEIAAALPTPLTSFVGRTREKDSVGRMLESTRLVTLTGTAGCGKRRLAVEVARARADDFEHGVAFVDLAAFTDPSLVLSAIAGALGISHHGTADLGAVRALIGSCRILLVMDNCEHVLDSCATIVADLLAHCAGARVLATSREQLATEGEVVFEVPPLGLAPRVEMLEQRRLGEESRHRIRASEAVELFVDRLRALVGRYEPDDRDLLAVASICRRLDGSPLAIELTAPIAATLTPRIAAARLDEDPALLGASRRRGPVARQATLTAALEWSYMLLDTGERDLFQRVSVFVGSFTLEAAERLGMLGGKSSRDVDAALHGLRRKSMVVAVDTGLSGGPPRYRLLETVRDYGLTLLADSGHEGKVRDGYARYYLELADRADEGCHGPNARGSLELIGRELPNFRNALWCAFDSKDEELAIRLAGALHWFFGRMGRYTELCKRLDAVLDRRATLDPPLRLRALLARNTLAWSIGDYKGKDQIGEEAIELAEQLRDRRQLLIALVVRGGIAIYAGDNTRAAECLTRAMPLASELGDTWARGWVIVALGFAARRSGDLARARLLCTEALELFEKMDNDQGRILPLINLALVAQQEQDFDAAIDWSTAAILASQRLGDRQQVSASVATLGRVYLDRGDVGKAREMLVAGLDGFRGAEHWPTVAIAIEGLAKVALHHGRAVDAAVIQGFSDALRQDHEIALSNEREVERDELLRRIDEQVGESAQQRARAFGEELSLDQAVRRAVEATMASEFEVDEASDVRDREEVLRA